MKFQSTQHFNEELHGRILAVLEEFEGRIDEASISTEEGGLTGEELQEEYQSFLVSDWPDIADDALTESGFYSEG